MYYNRFAPGLDTIDMAATDEFASLLEGARIVGTPPHPNVRYVSRNVVANGLRFHLLEWGDPDAPTVLLVHGGNHTAHTWDLVSMALADRFHVIAIDQRGHGDSEWPRDGDMTVTAMSTDIEALWDVLGFDQIRVVAHSRGGRACMPLLSRRDVAEKVVFVDVAPSLARPTPGERTARAAGAQANFTAIREYPSVDAYVEAVQKLDPARTREAVLRTMRYNMLQRVDGTLIAKTAPMNVGSTERIADPMSEATVDDLKTINCPVLLLRGADSPNLAQETAEAYVAALPDARLIVVPKCGHNVHTQNTPGFLSFAMPFLEGAPVPV